nr:metallophosphoesterase 1 homolog [Leptinotarsa decemlineata]
MHFFRPCFKRRLLHIPLILVILCVSHHEIFSYYLNTRNWPSLRCDNKNECTRILLVADPQIIGNNEEKYHFITPFSIFDSDRFVQKTYNHAFNFVQPDLVIFLGDLMDEAHKATDEEFSNYVRRLFNIFLSGGSPSNVRHIWLPGDNDIGGEDSLVTKNKIKRFDRAFSQPSLINFKNITFFKINRLISDIPVYKEKREFYNTDEIFVGLSHVPLMFKPSIFVDKVIEKMMPHLLFTAHEHKSMIISTDALLRQDFQIVPVTPKDQQIFEFTLGMTDMYEILIPTSSYRMGTDKVGYGYAIIENNVLRFTVLWSPSRFTQLKCYFYLILVIFLFIILYKCFICPKYSRIVRIVKGP